MRRLGLFFVVAVMLLAVSSPVAAAEAPISRMQGFLRLWRSIGRVIEDVSERPFVDLLPTDDGYAEVRYAKARGILDDDDERFRPHETLTRADALLWLFRTRSVEPVDRDNTHVAFAMPNPEDVPALADRYGLGPVDASSLTMSELERFMQSLDLALANEVREASLYSEKFHGKGTAFGETFDMHALTAAHRSLPHNTLVKVTNLQNGKSVIVRINDRGPYVQGRDIDLSLAAFTTIADRSAGHIDVTLERLGDASLVQSCAESHARQRRIAEGVILSPGVPHVLPLGQLLRLRSNDPFVIRDVRYPDDGTLGLQEWVVPGETYEFAPSIPGMYRLLIGTASGRRREMRMEVVECR